MADFAALRAELQQLYCPPIEATTFLAILRDYDISDPLQLDSAKEIFNLICATAELEEATGFDPSGSSGQALNSSDGRHEHLDEESADAKSIPGWSSNTDDTSLSQGLSSLSLDGSKESSDATNDVMFFMRGLDDVGKERQLKEIFPSLRELDVKLALKRCKGDASSAIDELMNLSFLEEEGSREKGVAGFSKPSDDAPARKRKKEARMNKKQRALGEMRSSNIATPTSNKWKTTNQDIEFLSTRTGIPTKEVGFIYHNNGATVRATILAIIKANSLANYEDEEPQVQINAAELLDDFPNIPFSDLVTLASITHPSTAYAHELAKALSIPSVSNKVALSVELRYNPIKVSDDVPPPLPSQISMRKNASDPVEATVRATALREARNSSFTRASAASRRAKSDHLMGAVAAHYGSIGREQHAALQQAEKDRTNAIVAQQSSETSVDLHGLTVTEAKRIAVERVNAWWLGLGEDRLGTRGYTGPGYLIITGKGTHSENGRAKLAPAVLKILIKDWRVEVGFGSSAGTLRVYGRRK